ncbi:MAG TPA: ABC transporter permease subunit [Gemmatimonadaceae bacterium]|nr:ABC transporter permease subunit [Gemmatimonadaceae bacterium]
MTFYIGIEDDVPPRPAGATRDALIRSVMFPLLVLCAVAPLLMLIVTSVARGWFYPAVTPSAFDGVAWRDLVADASHRDALRNSLVLGIATAVIATAVALPLGRAAALSSRSVRRIVALLAFTAVALPPVALGIGLQLTVLTLGLGGTVGGVLLAHLVPALGYLTLVFLGVFTRWDGRLDDAAATLGATGFVRLRLVTLPLLRRPIADAMALAFLVSWAQVALTLLVGGGAVRTLPLDVLAMLQAGQDQRAAAGALALAIPALVVLGASRVAARNTAAVIA